MRTLGEHTCDSPVMRARAERAVGSWQWCALFRRKVHLLSVRAGLRAGTDDGCRSGHPDRGHAHALDASAARQHACGARVGEAVAGVARAAAVPSACWLVRQSLLGSPVRRSLHTTAGHPARAAAAELDAGARAAHAREVDANVVDAQPRAPLQVETRPARPGRRIGRGGPKLRAA